MIEGRALAALDARLDRRSPDPLAVAVSGGGDSMGLLRLTAAWASRHGRPLVVLTVDHGLNPESAAWSRFVLEAAARLGVPARVLRWTGDKPGAGLPAAARAARHALLAEATRAAGARVLLMGHTADDLREAAAMRAEGSSVGDPVEWGPSPAWPEGRGVFLLRPLLEVGRAELRAWLRAEGEGWIEDPANADLRFHRARVRRELSDEGGATPHPTASRPSSPARGEGEDGVLIVCRSKAVAWLRPVLVCASGGTRLPRGDRLAALAGRLTAGEDFTATLAGARLDAQGDRVRVGREAGRAGLAHVVVSAGWRGVWDGRFEVEAGQDGTVRPLAGVLGRLAEAERAALRAVPAWQRPTLPVLETAAGLKPLARRSLVEERLLAACGAFAHEAALPVPEHGARRAGALCVETTLRASVR